MRTISIAAAAVGLMLNQSATPSYVGTWTASIAGNTFIRVELSQTNGVTGGRIGLGDISVTANGDVKTGGPITRMLPVSDVVLRGSTLSFASRDGDDTDHFEMQLVSNQSALLRIILTDEDIRSGAELGVPPPKPIPLNKSQ